MSEISCEDALIAKMAEADGEVSEDLQKAALHFDQCDKCRAEFSQLQAVDASFIMHARLEHQADLLPVIESRLANAGSRKAGWLPFAGLGVVLVGYKLFELLPEQGPSLAFHLVPVVIAVILFLLIKVNPFRVDTELTFER